MFSSGYTLADSNLDAYLFLRYLFPSPDADDSAYESDDSFFDGIQHLFDEMPADAPTHQQTAAIPTFDGTIGPKAKNFTTFVDNAKTLYGWSQEQAFNAACMRMIDEAQRWLRQVGDMGTKPTKWEKEANDGANIVGLKPLILDRFYDEANATQQVNAVRDLKQRSDEDVRMFCDRVTEACIISNRNLKDEANYKTILKNNVKQLLINGALEHLSAAVTNQPDIPDELADILKIMVNAENKNKPAPNAASDGFTTVNAVNRGFNGNRGNGQNRGNGNNGRGRGKVANAKTRCFNCNNYGHFSKDCSRPRKPGKNKGNNGNKSSANAVSSDNVNHVAAANAFTGTADNMAAPMMEDAEPFAVNLASGN